MKIIAILFNTMYHNILRVMDGMEIYEYAKPHMPAMTLKIL